MAVALTLYRVLSRLAPLVAPAVLRRRLVRGKEDPERWRERLGEATVARPAATVIWLNGVGLGEVMALRALIPALAEAMPAAHFLVTSTARSAAEALAGQMPERTQHQYLPLDAPRYLTRFFDHWRPDLAIWTDQDLWPGAIAEARRRGIPQVWLNGRMNPESLRRWRRLPGLLHGMLAPMPVVSVQSPALARTLQQIGVPQARIGLSLKAAAPPLSCDPAVLNGLRQRIGNRPVWTVTSSYAEDEESALAAHRLLVGQGDPAHPLLVFAPRQPSRGTDVVARARDAGFTVALRTTGAALDAVDVYVADTLGELGLWYRLAPVALIGGSFGATDGHNPYEATILGTVALHGPRVANFAEDYRLLDDEDRARPVTPRTLSEAVARVWRESRRAEVSADAPWASLRPLAAELAALLPGAERRR